MADHTKKKKNCTTAQRDTRAHRAHKRPPTRTAVAQQSATHAQHKTHAITEHEGKVHGHERLQRRLREPMISSSAADARPINCKSNVVPLAITRTNGPWMHTSDDSSYIYQLSLVLATATISSTVFTVRVLSQSRYCTMPPRTKWGWRWWWAKWVYSCYARP